eukprot:m.207103 g.207103  ORF g.207103 m.207103 type:complete len:288 (+) comp15801_c0_seq13:2799-3662(+)
MVGQRKHPIMAGAAAGILECTINYPMEYVKAQLQVGTHFKNPLQVVRETVNRVGVRGLYRGYPAFASFMLPSAATRFYAYNASLSLFSGLAPVHQALFAGLAAGVAEAGLVFTPCENVAITLLHDQMQPSPIYRNIGPLKATFMIAKTRGLITFWNGLTPNLFKIATCTMIRFGGYKYLKNITLEFYGKDSSAELTTLQSFACGAMVGAMSVPLTHPFDVVKTNMMALRGPYAGKSMLATARTLLEKEGYKSLFKGSSIRLVRVTSEQAFIFMFYEKISQLLDNVSY